MMLSASDDKPDPDRSVAFTSGADGRVEESLSEMHAEQKLAFVSAIAAARSTMPAS
jgi:hypothetical protein